MYWVVNITEPPQTVIIGDLNIEIGPKKAMDFEKMKLKHEIAESKDLKKAIKLRMLQVRHSVKSKKKDIVAEPQSNALNDKELAKIRLTIREEMQNVLGNQSSPELLQAVNSLLEATKNLKDTPPQKVIVEHTGGSSSINSQDDFDNIDDNIDDEILAEIHAKAVKNQTKDTETQLTYDERKGDNSVADRANELDGLLD